MIMLELEIEPFFLYFNDTMLKDLKNYNANEIEKKVLEFWDNGKIFEKSIKQRKNKPLFSFFDGPPFLSGTPHYGHILATAIKDAITRYKTMAGFKVERRVGWDCHGLPVEYLIEKDLGIKSKKDIEKLGIEKFNNACRASGIGSLDVFEKTLKRVGRWADYSNSYFTWDNDYIESVWWVFKKLWDQNLIYKDYRVSPYCPRCETPLSNFEVNQGYKETKDNSIFVKFKKKAAGETYFLAWTTTPWTLPGNVALAVAPNVKYVLVKQGSESYILAKDLLKVLNGPYKILKEFKGKDLEGEEYEPLFGSISRQNIDNIKNAFKILPADFVSTEDGTGIVHTAAMYGEDDFRLGKKYKLPMFHTVDESGNFKDCVHEWEGKFVKSVELEIIHKLQSRGLIYRTEEITHTYPFCWRCDSPLLYYALDSWYVAVTKIKSHLVKNNKKINWVPAHLKEGRFGNWLKDARDWGISRNRFWGAPFPVFKCDSGHFSAFGSLQELSDAVPKSGNKYFVLRHGGASSNDLDFLSSYPEKTNNGLTKKGITQVEKTADKLKNKKIDLIFSSDLLRTKETAQIVSKKTGVKIEFDKRLREWDFGILNGQPIEKLNQFYGNEINRFKKAPVKGESLTDVRSRMVDFVLELEKKYKDKNILIVGHGDPLWLLESAGVGLSDQKTIIAKKNYIKNGQMREIEFLNIPRDKTGQLNMHRPYIDDFKITCPHCKKTSKRITEVFDCWFESGAMPYGQWHYPFENKKLVENTFPADFIAEGIDQTRGWFYTLHVLASALTLKNIGLGKERPAFKNVVVNGLILAEDGQKLSKRLKNYTEPEIIFERLGADALRFFLLSSTPIGEDYRVSDRMVEETKRKIIDRFINSYKFYELYADKKTTNYKLQTTNILDKWILVRLNETILKMTKELDAYDLTEASRSFAAFLDDLSNWYIRRSRRRLQKPDNKKDFDDCSNILRYALLEASKLLAPFSPFVSEAIYKSLQTTNDKRQTTNSVHLEDWPIAAAQNKNEKIKNQNLIEGMKIVRSLASLALAKRAEAGIKVRQPLANLKIKDKKEKLKINEEFLKILAEEINVKQVVYDDKIKEEIELDTKITSELKEEGTIRELVRMVQDLRQEAGLKPQDKIAVFIQAEKESEGILDRHSNLFIKEINAFGKLSINTERSRSINAKSLQLKRTQKFDAESETKLENKNIWIGIKKV